MHATTTSLQLLGCFRLSVGVLATHLPLQSQRLIAYLAVTEGASARLALSERLWPFTASTRAQANLRTALWRIRQEAPNCVAIENDAVQLGRRVIVDYHHLFGSGQSENWALSVDENRVVAQLRSELLPGWDEEWLIIAREQARQLQMRRLEELSRRFLSAGNTTAAIASAFASIEIEPLRESAHLALIEAHIVDGNLAEATNQAVRLSKLVRNELGIAPSSRFQDRLKDIGVVLAT